jgi:hypothetical protein
MENRQTRAESAHPGESGSGTPAPEKGSPVPADTDAHDDEDRSDQKNPTNGNPLAPPINTDAGS